MERADVEACVDILRRSRAKRRRREGQQRDHAQPHRVRPTMEAPEMEPTPGPASSPPPRGALHSSHRTGNGDSVAVWLESAAGQKLQSMPLKSGMKKSSSATTVHGDLSGMKSSRDSKPRVSISPYNSLTVTASTGQQLAKYAASLVNRRNAELHRLSDSGDSASSTTRYRGISGFRAWGKGLMLKAYEAKGELRQHFSRICRRRNLTRSCFSQLQKRKG